MKNRIVYLVLLAVSAILATGTAWGADECKNRGTLDEMYCDENMDLVADPPTDPNDWKDPGTLVFTYTPVEDPAVYKDAFADFSEVSFRENRQRSDLLHRSVQRRRG